jgi:hypothetical protein
MVNRCKRRPLLIVFFSIQFILFSIYTFLYYQNNYSDDSVKIIDKTTISPAIDHLPANLIEKSDRSVLNKNYKIPKIQHLKLKNNLPNSEKLQELNVSFVKDIDQEQTLVQCPILPTNLSNLY